MLTLKRTSGFFAIMNHLFMIIRHCRIHSTEIASKRIVRSRSFYLRKMNEVKATSNIRAMHRIQDTKRVHELIGTQDTQKMNRLCVDVNS